MRRNKIGARSRGGGGGASSGRSAGIDHPKETFLQTRPAGKWSAGLGLGLDWVTCMRACMRACIERSHLAPAAGRRPILAKKERRTNRRVSSDGNEEDQPTNQPTNKNEEKKTCLPKYALSLLMCFAWGTHTCASAAELQAFPPLSPFIGRRTKFRKMRVSSRPPIFAAWGSAHVCMYGAIRYFGLVLREHGWSIGLYPIHPRRILRRLVSKSQPARTPFPWRGNTPFLGAKL